MTWGSYGLSVFRGLKEQVEATAAVALLPIAAESMEVSALLGVAASRVGCWWMAR